MPSSWHVPLLAQGARACAEPEGWGWSHHALPSGQALLWHAGPNQPRAHLHRKAPPPASHQPRLLQGGEPGHLVRGTTGRPLPGGGVVLPQSSSGPAPPAPSLA